ncbi:hypothetical protein [Tsukamurella tyrosinosolvens]|uniref:hypothetical protein n=1 Tax=Tsukamurella tyrosinosolvens TaxID=57704 RepID=UPI000DF6F03D|nr:hypothetical protein [Tsukamurella tyrosinosolvens]RDB47720.1 hypothetical protein DVB87_11805 [Tsukamurella tyrosinosolvens]
MQKRTIRTSRAALAAVAMALLVPGVAGVGAASADPSTDAECRMFETKPGYECRFGKWARDFTPPSPGKSCTIGETAPGQRLTCSGGIWIVKPAYPGGEKCTAVGAQRVGPGGLQSCTHGPYGFTWE